MTRLARWPGSLLVSQLFEVPVYLVTCKHLPWPRRVGVAFGVRLLAHLFVWFLGGPWLVPEPYGTCSATSRRLAP